MLGPVKIPDPSHENGVCMPDPEVPTPPEFDREPVRKPQSAGPDRDLGEIISAVTDGWTCPECRYELKGQSIHVEPTYRFLVSRCPECGRVWPAQMQDLRPAVRRRLASTSAFLWWALVGGGLLGIGMYLFGMAASAASWARWRGDIFGWVALSDILWHPPVMLVAAVTAAIGLSHLSTRRLLLLAIAPAVIGFLSTVALLLSDIGRNALTEEVMAAMIHLGAGYVAMVLAVLVARPIARLITLVFMSKNMRITVSGLWTAEGRTPPWLNT